MCRPIKPLDSQETEQVKQHCYLESTISDVGQKSKEEQHVLKLFSNKNVLVNNYMFCLEYVLSGSGTCILREREKAQLEAVEMWMWRKIIKATWVERKTDVEFLK